MNKKNQNLPNQQENTYKVDNLSHLGTYTKKMVEFSEEQLAQKENLNKKLNNMTSNNSKNY